MYHLSKCHATKMFIISERYRQVKKPCHILFCTITRHYTANGQKKDLLSDFFVCLMTILNDNAPCPLFYFLNDLFSSNYSLKMYV